MSVQDPRDQLMREIQSNHDLFHGVVGKANSTTTAVITTILNTMGTTIMTQYDTIMQLRAENTALKPKDVKKVESKIEPPKELPVEAKRLIPPNSK